MIPSALAAFTLGIVLAGTLGCTAPGPSRSAPVVLLAPVAESRAPIADQQVALDFVNAVLQLIPADSGPLYFPSEDVGVDLVLDTMRRMLVEVGYDVELVDEGTDAPVASHDVLEIASSEGAVGKPVLRHDVAVGDLRLRRSYRSTGTGTVLPASALYVKGADAASVKIRDEVLFGIGTPEPEDEPPPPSPSLSEELLASYRYLLVGDPAAVAAIVGGTGTAARDELRQLGEAVRVSGLGALETVVEHDMAFIPGSDRLGAADIALIGDVLGRLDAATDIVSIVGYSSGDDADLDAELDMARRRAERVRTALTAAGVPPDRVLVEGYLAAPVGTGEPARGATLALKRRAT